MAVLGLFGIGGSLLLAWPSGWQVNRLNVAVWIAVTGPLGLNGSITPDQFSDAMNVLLFVFPFAALAVIRPSRWWIAAGVLVSAAAETWQHVLGTRQAELLDIVTNSLGAAAGVVIGSALHRWAVRRDARRGSDDGVDPDEAGPSAS